LFFFFHISIMTYFSLNSSHFCFFLNNESQGIFRAAVLSCTFQKQARQGLEGRRDACIPLRYRKAVMEWAKPMEPWKAPCIKNRRKKILRL